MTERAEAARHAEQHATPTPQHADDSKTPHGKNERRGKAPARGKEEPGLSWTPPLDHGRGQGAFVPPQPPPDRRPRTTDAMAGTDGSIRRRGRSARGRDARAGTRTPPEQTGPLGFCPSPHVPAPLQTCSVCSMVSMGAQKACGQKGRGWRGRRQTARKSYPADQPPPARVRVGGLDGGAVEACTPCSTARYSRNALAVCGLLPPVRRGGRTAIEQGILHFVQRKPVDPRARQRLHAHAALIGCASPSPTCRVSRSGPTGLARFPTLADGVRVLPRRRFGQS